MKLLANWRQVLTRAWSVRLLIIAGFLSGMEAAVPLLDGYFSIDKGVFAFLAFIATGGAFVARLLAQDCLSGEDDDTAKK